MHRQTSIGQFPYHGPNSVGADKAFELRGGVLAHGLGLQRRYLRHLPNLDRIENLARRDSISLSPTSWIDRIDCQVLTVGRLGMNSQKTARGELIHVSRRAARKRDRRQSRFDDASVTASVHQTTDPTESKSDKKSRHNRVEQRQWNHFLKECPTENPGNPTEDRSVDDQPTLGKLKGRPELLGDRGTIEFAPLLDYVKEPCSEQPSDDGPKDQS